MKRLLIVMALLCAGLLRAETLNYSAGVRPLAVLA